MEKAIKQADFLNMSVLDYLTREIFLFEQQKDIIEEKLKVLRADVHKEMQRIRGVI